MVKVCLAGLWRQELETYSAPAARHFPHPGRPAIDRPVTDRDAQGRFTEARNLVFNRPIATPGGAPAQIEETQE